MVDADLEQWNRRVASDAIELLEKSRDSANKAIDLLRGFLAVNPGGEMLPRAGEPCGALENAVEGL